MKNWTKVILPEAVRRNISQFLQRWFVNYAKDFDCEVLQSNDWNHYPLNSSHGAFGLSRLDGASSDPVVKLLSWRETSLIAKAMNAAFFRLKLPEVELRGSQS